MFGVEVPFEAMSGRTLTFTTDISVPPRRINEIVKDAWSVIANTALWLARYFAMSERFRLDLQSYYDLETERDRLGASLNKDVRTLANAD